MMGYLYAEHESLFRRESEALAQSATATRATLIGNELC